MQLFAGARSGFCFKSGGAGCTSANSSFMHFALGEVRLHFFFGAEIERNSTV